MPLTVEEKRARAIAWNKANPDKVRGYRQRWYAQHREEEAARARRQNKANPDKVRERVRRYREAHPDKVREWTRRYREAHPDNVREWTRRWRERRKAALQAEVEAVADQAAQSAPTGRVVAPCGHCGGQIVLRWEDPTCLQCGRSPTRAARPRAGGAAERPARRAPPGGAAGEGEGRRPSKADAGRFRAVRPRVRLAPAATRAS